MGEPLCLAFSFCNTPWCLTSSSFYSNCSLVVAKPNGSHFLSKDYCWVSSDVTQLPFLVFWSHLATSRWVHGKGGSLLKHYVQLRHCCVDKMVVTGFQMVKKTLSICYISILKPLFLLLSVSLLVTHFISKWKWIAIPMKCTSSWWWDYMRQFFHIFLWF